MKPEIVSAAYTQDAWAIMQRAYYQAIEMLGLLIRTNDDAERLAREVMRLFDRGYNDIGQLATMACNVERRMRETSHPVVTATMIAATA
ncbi:hypothetical protein HB779_06980 [Phyllobacterium sp. 628]|uniref:hypothetical protein n=1 Tax=Phyllobacterium sp. 628 TaxID=2718938 RepID=UPI001662383B|nr:hypothetical protein [Phyllobacterium sp. 628]QND51672.1 hypothetical protein HB779_06980 [Phyllobacterium sp. 628]